MRTLATSIGCVIAKEQAEVNRGPATLYTNVFDCISFIIQRDCFGDQSSIL